MDQAEALKRAMWLKEIDRLLRAQYDAYAAAPLSPRISAVIERLQSMPVASRNPVPDRV
jgi:hypothetical protein